MGLVAAHNGASASESTRIYRTMPSCDSAAAGNDTGEIIAATTVAANTSRIAAVLFTCHLLIISERAPVRRWRLCHLTHRVKLRRPRHRDKCKMQVPRQLQAVVQAHAALSVVHVNCRSHGGRGATPDYRTRPNSHEAARNTTATTASWAIARLGASSFATSCLTSPSGIEPST